jgi:hypothetical protein
VMVSLNGSLAGRSLVGRRAPSATLAPGALAQVTIRPEDIEVCRGETGRSPTNQLPGIIDTLSFVGDRYEARVSLGSEHRIVLLLGRDRAWREGDRIELGFPPELVSVWPA